MGPWVPVAFAAVIIIGAVGGQLIHMTLKELLPLLRTIAEQKHRRSVAASDTAVVDRLAALEQRMERLERGMNQLTDEGHFMRQLLDREGSSRQL